MADQFFDAQVWIIAWVFAVCALQSRTNIVGDIGVTRELWNIQHRIAVVSGLCGEGFRCQKQKLADAEPIIVDAEVAGQPLIFDGELDGFIAGLQQLPVGHGNHLGGDRRHFGRADKGSPLHRIGKLAVGPRRKQGFCQRNNQFRRAERTVEHNFAGGDNFLCIAEQLINRHGFGLG